MCDNEIERRMLMLLSWQQHHDAPVKYIKAVAIDTPVDLEIRKFGQFLAEHHNGKFR